MRNNSGACCNGCFMFFCHVILNHSVLWSGIIPPSPQEYPILGLNLLRLLVQNRIAEFHTELELLPVTALENPCIKHAVELEQSFMEGAYNRVLSARQAVPHETYVYFMDLLAKTVRSVWLYYCITGASYLMYWFKIYAAHNPLFECLFCTCRDELAGCSEKGYDYMSIAEARQVLMFSSDKELHQYIEEVIALPPLYLCASRQFTWYKPCI